MEKLQQSEITITSNRQERTQLWKQFEQNYEKNFKISKKIRINIIRIVLKIVNGRPSLRSHWSDCDQYSVNSPVKPWAACNFIIINFRFEYKSNRALSDSLFNIFEYSHIPSNYVFIMRPRLPAHLVFDIFRFLTIGFHLHGIREGECPGTGLNVRCSVCDVVRSCQACFCRSVRFPWQVIGWNHLSPQLSILEGALHPSLWHYSPGLPNVPSVIVSS